MHDPRIAVGTSTLFLNYIGLNLEFIELTTYVRLSGARPPDAYDTTQNAARRRRLTHAEKRGPSLVGAVQRARG